MRFFRSTVPEAPCQKMNKDGKCIQRKQPQTQKDRPASWELMFIPFAFSVTCLLWPVSCWVCVKQGKNNQATIDECQRVFGPWRTQHNILTSWTCPIKQRRSGAGNGRLRLYKPGKLTIVVPLSGQQQNLAGQQQQQFQATAVQIVPVPGNNYNDVKMFQ